MEVFVLIDTVKRANVNSIIVVLPIFPYQRQDRKSYSRNPITASMVACMLEGLGIDRVICFELHACQIQGFFIKCQLII
jgi:ribose-phosphate pyrophosphokinase